MSLEVATNETGKVRVFALSISSEHAEYLRSELNEQTTLSTKNATENEIVRLIGAEILDPKFIEIFPISDLGELGLAGYLVEGHGIDREGLDTDRIKLNALSGWVVLAHSSAFAKNGEALTPKPNATLIGTYNKPSADWSSQTNLQSARAQRQSNNPTKSVSDAAMSGRIASAALLVLFVLTALMIWIAS